MTKPFLLGNPNPHLQQRISRLKSHHDFDRFLEHLALIGASPATLAELLSKGLLVHATQEGAVYEQNENPTTFAYYQVALQLHTLFEAVQGYSEPPAEHLLQIGPSPN